MAFMLIESILDVLSAFCGDRSLRSMQCARGREWSKALEWMDTSGVALYFLRQVEERCLTEWVPEYVLASLRTRQIQNRERVADLARELKELGKDLQAAGVRFLLLKGLANVPEACADPALRLQVDLDLMVEQSSMERVQDLLKGHGYGLTAMGRGAWEFRTRFAEIPRLADIYRAKPQRSLDVHPVSAAAFEESYASRCEREVLGTPFFALSSVDRLLAQAQHLAKHMHGEWTRLGWLIEMRSSLNFWAHDEAFWQEVGSRMRTDENVAQSLATALLLCRVVLGETWSNSILREAEQTLPQAVRLWIAEYGREAVLRSFPGSKLYLLIPAVDGGKKQEVQRRLLPLSVPPTIVPDGESGEYRIRAFWAQMGFLAFRLRFHIREGTRYLLTAPRWRRLVAHLEESR